MDFNNVKIWVDDLRPAPAGYEGTKSVDETIALIGEIFDRGCAQKCTSPFLYLSHKRKLTELQMKKKQK